MVRNGKKLFYSLLEKQHNLNSFLFNMVNKPIDEGNRFSLIYGYNTKNDPITFFVWNSQEEILHGPYEVIKDRVVTEDFLVIDDYKW